MIGWRWKGLLEKDNNNASINYKPQKHQLLLRFIYFQIGIFFYQMFSISSVT
jgi:hypothetical protein